MPACRTTWEYKGGGAHLPGGGCYGGRRNHGGDSAVALGGGLHRRCALGVDGAPLCTLRERSLGGGQQLQRLR
eukprot:746240-Alexandrium_andersonii.AAC.1